MCDGSASAPLELLSKLAEEHCLSRKEYERLIEGYSRETAAKAAALADKERRRIYGTDVYIRGLIEIGNICRRDCYYCGIRASNRNCSRYVLTDEQILDCAAVGHKLGFRTFVLQSGEGSMSVGRIIGLVGKLKENWPDAAVNLSLGEYSYGDYLRMYEAGADRYLLRHETADPGHYAKLHPAKMSWDDRMRCLRDLRAVGFQTGCGFMVGSPYQSAGTLAQDLKFIEEFKPEMCGIGPFIPHRETPFRNEPPGDAGLTCYLLSLIRLIRPDILLPATTALATVDSEGRKKGILSGANVIMPNLSPADVRDKYDLYNNKLSSGTEAAEGLAVLKEDMNAIGYRIVTSRGDHIMKN